MKKNSSEYRLWKKKNDEKKLRNRKKSKKSTNHSSNTTKSIGKRSSNLPYKVFVPPKQFSILNNPAETINFFNYILDIIKKIPRIKNSQSIYLLMIDMTQPCLSPIILHPVRNVVPNLVYSAKGSEVELVMVDGNILIENFQVLTVDEKQVVRDAQAAVERVCKAAELPFSKIPESRLHRMMQNDEL